MSKLNVLSNRGGTSRNTPLNTEKTKTSYSLFNRSHTINNSGKDEEVETEATPESTKNFLKFKSLREEFQTKKKVVQKESKEKLMGLYLEDNLKRRDSNVLSSPERSVLSGKASRSGRSAQSQKIATSRPESEVSYKKRKNVDYNTISTDRNYEKYEKPPNSTNKAEENRQFSHRPSLTLSGNTISTAINRSNITGTNPLKPDKAFNVFRNKTVNLMNNLGSSGSFDPLKTKESVSTVNALPEIKSPKNESPVLNTVPTIMHTLTDTENAPSHNNEILNTLHSQKISKFDALTHNKDNATLETLHTLNNKLTFNTGSELEKKRKETITQKMNKEAHYQNYNLSNYHPNLEEIKYLINKKNNSTSQNEKIMNIVNNVNPKKTDKKVEINFNQYDIKIMQEKKKNEQFKTDITEDSESGQSEIIEEREESSKGSSHTKKKNKKSTNQPTKIVINKASQKKIVLRINNKDDGDNVSVTVSQSPRDSISISYKTNKENESSSKEKSDSSAEFNQKSKRVLLNELLEISEKEEPRDVIDNSKSEEVFKAKEENAIQEPFKDQTKVNKLLKPFNKNFMRQLSKISEISNIISKGYDSNTGNSFESNPILKMKNKVKEVKENLTRINHEEIELKKNLLQTNDFIEAKNSSNENIGHIQGTSKHLENVPLLDGELSNLHEDNEEQAEQAERFEIPKKEKDLEDIPKLEDFYSAEEAEKEVINLNNSDNLKKYLSESNKTGKCDTLSDSENSSKEVDLDCSSLRGIEVKKYSHKSHSVSSSMTSEPSKHAAFDRRHTIAVNHGKKLTKIKSLIHNTSPTIKPKSKNRVRFSVIHTVFDGEGRKVEEADTSFERQPTRTRGAIGDKNSSEKGLLSESGFNFVNRKCETELHKSFKQRRLKKLYKRLQMGILDLHLRDLIFQEAPDTYTDNYTVEAGLLPLKVKDSHAELLLSSHFHDTKFKNFSFDFFARDMESESDKITLFENFDIYNNDDLKHNLKQLGRNKKELRTSSISRKKVSFEDFSLGSEEQKLGLLNVIYYNKYLLLDLPENDMIEFVDTDNPAKRIELKMKSNPDLLSLITKQTLTPKLTAAIRRKSSVRMPEGSLFMPKISEDKLNKSRLSNRSDAMEELSEEQNESVNHEVDNNISSMKMKKRPLKRKMTFKTTTKTQTKKMTESEMMQKVYPKKYSILSNADFFEINFKHLPTIQDRKWGEDLQKLIQRRKFSLFTSLTNINRKNSIKEKSDEDEPVNKSHKMMNKESMLFRTHEIKSKLLKKYELNPKLSLFFYIKDDNFQKFKEIMEKNKFSTEEVDEDDNTLLNLAVQCNSLSIVEYLINCGADVNTQNNKLNTPLHYALSHKNFSISDLLIKRRADEGAKNSSNMTPWQCLTNIKSNV